MISSLKQLAMKKGWIEVLPNVFRDDKQRTIRKEKFDNEEYYHVFSFDEGDHCFDTLDELVKFYN